MACCQYHRSLYTYGGIALSCILTFLSIISMWPFITGLITLIAISGTCCCKMHQYIFYVACILALISSIGCFVAAGEGKCPDGSDNCDEKAIRRLGIITGIFWLLDILIIYKIPAGPQERRGSGSPGSFNQEHAGENA